MAAASVTDWDNLPDDSKWIFESMARLGFAEFADLTIADQSLVLALAIHLKRTSQRAERYEA
jgi:hypothetical protein